MRLIKFKEERDFERRVAQNERLINHDFPWLWAIRNFWDTTDSELDIKVIDAESDANIVNFAHFLCQICSDDIEVWIRYEELYKNYSAIKKVEYDAGHSVNWAFRILEAVSNSFSRHFPIDNIAIISEFSDLDHLKPKKIQIYRIKRKKFSMRDEFNKMLMKVARTSE